MNAFVLRAIQGLGLGQDKGQKRDNERTIRLQWAAADTGIQNAFKSINRNYNLLNGGREGEEEGMLIPYG